MLISLHMPKCGGSSFRALLRDHFQYRFSKDYDFPIHQPIDQRIKKVKRAQRWIEIGHKYFLRYRFTECVHGHFLPYKYNHFYGNEGAVFVTWLRDPIERLVSHYYYWQRTYDAGSPKPLHRRVIEEEWTLKEFAFSKELQNLYSQFLWNFPLEQFDFIGITEHYEEDFKYFAEHYLGLQNVTVPQKNINPNRSKVPFEDEELLKALKSFHNRDYELYNHALKARKAKYLHT